MELYNYVFHFSPYNEVWSAFKRENHRKYFNGELNEEDVLKSKDIMVLVHLIKKKEKEKKKIND